MIEPHRIEGGIGLLGQDDRGIQRVADTCFGMGTGIDVDMLFKGYIARDVPESDRRINDRQLTWIDKWAHSYNFV